jgi:hypothetical protein
MVFAEKRVMKIFFSSAKNGSPPHGCVNLHATVKRMHHGKVPSHCMTALGSIANGERKTLLQATMPSDELAAALPKMPQWIGPCSGEEEEPSDRQSSCTARLISASCLSRLPPKLSHSISLDIE